MMMDIMIYIASSISGEIASGRGRWSEPTGKEDMV